MLNGMRSPYTRPSLAYSARRFGYGVYLVNSDLWSGLYILQHRGLETTRLTFAMWCLAFGRRTIDKCPQRRLGINIPNAHKYAHSDLNHTQRTRLFVGRGWPLSLKPPYPSYMRKASRCTYDQERNGIRFNNETEIRVKSGTGVRKLRPEPSSEFKTRPEPSSEFKTRPESSSEAKWTLGRFRCHSLAYRAVTSVRRLVPPRAPVAGRRGGAPAYGTTGRVRDPGLFLFREYLHTHPFRQIGSRPTRKQCMLTNEESS
ncbi:hypothetical protein EVAR_47533_1 [Eumeta japonica]|uniref:Uncharacterized protein n=1 Tax=Eumeta variegata TaxID=151549 RepID=A0A4C1XSK7_EUMVA|nr:hypothetical protein EVAR_47533_1 [Eumeta japonica]